MEKRLDLNDYFNVGDVVQVTPFVYNLDDNHLGKIVKVGKTTVKVDMISCVDTNMGEVLHNIKYYGQSAKWYRKYKKADIISYTTDHGSLMTIKARELGVYQYKGKIHDNSYLYKIYDAKLNKFTKEVGKEIIIENEKRWYD